MPEPHKSKTQPQEEIDGAKFSQLIIQSQRRMRNLILAMVPGCREVDDILQESCAAMWAKIGSFDPELSFERWSLGYVRMQTLAWLKRQGRDRLRMSGDALDLLCQEMDPGDKGPSDHRRIDALEDCLGLLSESEKKLMTSRYIDGDSVSKLAGTSSGRTTAAIYKQFSRLQVRLLRCIEGKLSELQ